MGYRSDVAVALSKKAAARLKAKLKATKDKDKRYLFDHVDAHDTSESTGQELWLRRNVKWYKGYTEVDFVTGFLNSLDEDDYLCIIVGEATCDVEITGNFWQNAFGLDVATSIVTA